MATPTDSDAQTCLWHIEQSSRAILAAKKELRDSRADRDDALRALHSLGYPKTGPNGVAALAQRAVAAAGLDIAECGLSEQSVRQVLDRSVF